MSNLVIVLFDSTILWLSFTLKDILAGKCKMSVALSEWDWRELLSYSLNSPALNHMLVWWSPPRFEVDFWRRTTLGFGLWPLKRLWQLLLYSFLRSLSTAVKKPTFIFFTCSISSPSEKQLTETQWASATETQFTIIQQDSRCSYLFILQYATIFLCIYINLSLI